MIVLRMSRIFTDAADQLPKEAKAKLVKVFRLLSQDPRHPSLQLKKIAGAARSDVYECRVNDFWRLILRQAADMAFDLIYVGAHDDAIRRGLMVREGLAPYGPRTTRPNAVLSASLAVTKAPSR